MVKVLVRKQKGGFGSGNWGHKGRPGMVGGSSPVGGSAMSTAMSNVIGKRDVNGDAITRNSFLDAKGYLQELVSDTSAVTDSIVADYITGKVSSAATLKKLQGQSAQPTKKDAVSVATPVPKLSDNSGKDLTAYVRSELEKKGLVRESPYAGAENTGLTKSIGSTGYSVRDVGNGLSFNIVLSGKKVGLKYVENTSGGYRPTESSAQVPIPNIAAVFKSMGFKVSSVSLSGYQTMWDDDVEYTIYTDYGNVR